MFALITPFLSKKAFIIIGILLLLIGVYIKGRYDGVSLMEAQYAQEKIEWENKIATIQSDFDKTLQDTVDYYNKESTKTKQIIKYVKSKPEVITKYVSKNSDDNCVIPNTFVELHNKAADNTSLTDLHDIKGNGVSSKKLSDVANTVTLNYYQYNEMKTKLETLQKIVKEYQLQQGKLFQ